METRNKDLLDEKDAQDEPRTLHLSYCPKEPIPDMKYPPVIIRRAPMRYDPETGMSYFVTPENEDVPKGVRVIYVRDENDSSDKDKNTCVRLMSFFKFTTENKKNDATEHENTSLCRIS